jgi:hypothetical protein
MEYTSRKNMLNYAKEKTSFGKIKEELASKILSLKKLLLLNYI